MSSSGAAAATFDVFYVVVVVVVVADGFVVLPLSPAGDIGMTASFVTVVFVVNAAVMRVEAKTAGQLCCQRCINNCDATVM
jgi:hypothetical protein